MVFSSASSRRAINVYLVRRLDCYNAIPPLIMRCAKLQILQLGYGGCYAGQIP